jgi:F0F1-type ATP synthase delta subunit
MGWETAIPMVVLLLMIFAGLALGLRWFMTRNLSSATAHLQGMSQDYLRKHDELKKRLEEAERFYQEQMAKAQDEAAALKSQALKDAEAERQRAINQAHEEAERIVQQANQAREAMRRELQQSMEQRAIGHAQQLLAAAMPEALRAAAHAQWVDALLGNGLVSLDGVQTREAVSEALVTTAFALTPAQREQIGQRLRTTLGREVTLKEQVDPAMIAGLVIQLGHLVLDGSLATKLQEAARNGHSTGS